jgi:hypothetical protein
VRPTVYGATIGFGALGFGALGFGALGFGALGFGALQNWRISYRSDHYLSSFRYPNAILVAVRSASITWKSSTQPTPH